MDRVLVIDKPSGITSHDVVQGVRRVLRERRVGHAGTLDPAATGVLVILVGRATRLSQFLMASDKEYEGRMVLGATTNTHDGDGTVISTGDWASVTEERFRDVCAAFTGDLLQTPPMVSAVKLNGRPLYELARRGIEVERNARPIVIREMDIIEFEPPNIRFRVVCSKGTYVRTLASDIGDSLGCGAHLGELRRTRSGDFDVDEAVELREIGNELRKGRTPGRSLFDALAGFPVVTLSERQLDAILEGQAVEATDVPGYADGTLMRATHDGMSLTAIARIARRSDAPGTAMLRPVRVFGEELGGEFGEELDGELGEEPGENAE
ncbi:tRNA pseudouridine(55) synthase TruB [bacterium]|nr:tRNA pseudouridine(55) synthase TruB [bacterium]